MNKSLLMCMAAVCVAGCNPVADRPAETGQPVGLDGAHSVPGPIGESWSFIDDADQNAEWTRVGAAQDGGSFNFKSGDVNYKVTLFSEDRVSVAQAQPRQCEYTGRIWTETDLDAFEAFAEDPDPAKRPNFYRIITGTYVCDGMEEPGTWAAKINSETQP